METSKRNICLLSLGFIAVTLALGNWIELGPILSLSVFTALQREILKKTLLSKMTTGEGKSVVAENPCPSETLLIDT